MPWPNPKVVISDTPPPIVQCRDGREVQACEALLDILRHRGEPLLVVYRKADGAIEVAAKSKDFASVAQAVDVMKEATVKLTQSVFRVLRRL